MYPNRQVGPPVFYNPIDNAKHIVKNIKGLFFQYVHIRETERSTKGQVHLWDPDMKVNRRQDM